MTGRISLVEQYENKDVIVQVKKCLDNTAEAVTVSQASAATATEAATNANAASARANAASEQAETASATVATYEARLGAAEDGVAANRSSIQTIDGEITDIYNDLTNVVRKVGEAGQVVMNGLDLRGTNSVPDTVIGQSDARPANGKRVIDELDAYQPMVRTTGNQVVSGIKEGLWYGVNKWSSDVNTQNNKWVRVASVNGAAFQIWNYSGQLANNGLAEAEFMPMGAWGYGRHVVLNARATPPFSGKVVIMTNNSTLEQEIWVYVTSDYQFLSIVKGSTTSNTVYNTVHDTLPTSGYQNVTYVLGSE